jgi:hypothetical protein
MIYISKVHKVKNIERQAGGHLMRDFFNNFPWHEKYGIHAGYSFKLPFLLADLEISYIIGIAFRYGPRKFVKVFLPNAGCDP